MTSPDLKYYTCEYHCGERHLRSCVCATPDTIDAILSVRNIGETVAIAAISKHPRFKPLSVILARDGCINETLHYAIYISWLALKSGVVDVDDILEDRGLVHEMSHYLGDYPDFKPYNSTFIKIVEMARTIERAIPGHFCEGETTFCLTQFYLPQEHQPHVS